uniref:sensor domain-containing protein n=1 Tax=Nocardia brasiliensis TaxID=37326 RepID=UPI00313C0307
RLLPGAIGYLAVGSVTSLAAMFAVIGLLLVLAFCLIGVGIPAVPEALGGSSPLVATGRRLSGYAGSPAEDYFSTPS